MHTKLTPAEFGKAYEQGFRRTVAVLRRRGANAELAEEKAQLAWARAWERLSQLRETQNLHVWITSIALNAYRDQVRKDACLTELSPAIADVRVSPAVDLERLDLRRALRKCPSRQRTILEAVYLEHGGRDTGMVAAAFGISEGALYHRLSRGRRALRKAMAAA